MDIPWWDDINPATRARLTALGFDLPAFETRRRKVASGELTPSSNHISGTITPPAPDDLIELPPIGSEAFRRYEQLGVDALRAGQVCVVVLNGGMATRFGGVVKGTVKVTSNRSFLQLCLDDVRAWQRELGCTIPMFLLNSFATDEATRQHLAREQDVTISWLMQSVALRLSPSGDIFHNETGEPDFCAPGHGDLVHAWQRSEEATAWSKRPNSLVLISNVDNVLATIAPVVIGAHLNAARPLTVETVRKNPGDVGGAPARVDGQLQIVEGFRFPTDFEQDSISVFSTNSFVLDASVLLGNYDLTWYCVAKRAGEVPVIQLEQLFNELTAHIDTTVLVVPREGPAGRFLPVKSPADLAAARMAVEAS